MTKEVYLSIREVLFGYIRGTRFDGKVYCVGGCVRDYCLGVDIKDIDLVIELRGGGIELARYFQDLGILLGSPVIYENFGTVSFRLRDFPEYEIEAVQTRSEKYISRESRDPIVGYGSFEDDWRRRDFTINSLYHPLSAHPEDREIIDASGRGFSDLDSRKISTTSDPGIIFDDDPLRILRCIRFAVVLGWEIEDECWKNVCLFSDRLCIISIERITAELDKILMSSNPVRGLELLRESGILRIVLPALQETTEMTQNRYHLGTVWEHTLSVVEKCAGKKREVIWAALLHDIGKLGTRTEEGGKVHFIGHDRFGEKMVRETILPGLRFSRKDIDHISRIVGLHMIFKGSYTPKMKRIRRLEYICGEELFYDLLDVIEADNMSHSPEFCIIGQVDKIKKMVEEDGIKFFDYQLPISGKEIMEVKKIGPSPIIKAYKEHALKLMFANPSLTKEELLKLIRNTKEANL